MIKKIWRWIFPIISFDKYDREIPKPKIIYAEYHGSIMTTKYSNGVSREFEGSCTVWGELPMMKSCGTLESRELLDVWKYIKHWGNNYPDAHLKKDNKQLGIYIVLN